MKLTELNERQREAVENLEGPLLVVAGAGSGKTRVLTYRIANLIDQKKARPNEILAVTFTNKAAREMKERVQKILSLPSDQLWVSTFHSSCVKILRREIEVLGTYTPAFTIYDEQDQLSAIKKTLKELNWDEKVIHPRAAQSRISHAKNCGLTPEKFLKKALSSYDEKMAELYKRYQAILQKANALDFDDLLLLTVQLFQKHPNILEKYQNLFKYCLVDEYQDTNHIQYLFMKLLVDKHHNICVVGDEDQSIYSWRGADISNILSFEKDFPKAKVIKLEQNYRSTKNIIEAASAVVSHNKSRKPKKLWTQREEGASLHLVQLEDEYHEARFVVGEISKALEAGISLNQFSIFYRTNAQSRVFEEILRQYTIAYKIYGGMNFYNRSEIKDIMAYFRLLSNPKDDVSFLRIINVPTRGIGKTTVDKIELYSHENNLPFLEAAQKIIQGDTLNAGTAKKILDFIGIIQELRQKKEELNPQALYHAVLDKTQYSHFLKGEDTIESLSRLENLEELDSALGEFVKQKREATLETYLEEISLISDLDSMDENEDHVKLMTLHAAKGLEFPYVFMVGVEEGLFPHSRGELDFEDMEEERRLCYVGMTRAKEALYMSHANSRRIHGSPQYNLPSRFLDEIPEEFVKRIDLRRRVGNRRLSVWAGGAEGEAPSPRPERMRGRTMEGVLRRQDPEGYEWDFDQRVSDNPFSPGIRLRHPHFGSGVICRVEGQEENLKVTIKFDNGAIKKFLATQTQFERI
ncbi:MAG: hypothetical protein A2Z91_04180 [Deltaproteobacteria bacterium GWA2_38_16]|nr:MAG: hypothetical protein A2Z91_04180 [Deltaproteobacteria bacterium GWA2_38_16]OGQ01797.1 MAG: hypothetical protein A3D19_08000 [Deltaproteobacteria bacterium RIFCSPHIGHO2_02_FULL_38_15]OGQ30252.1 MAG: hypothetical protein A3A72_08370 [Deltaproteobacteria bacterium RIFCSPLOWO2_01_FULL_38_9]OGQ58897.1 MAG: hypothetical protein A3G92_07820 [Deltaproteobacteria bacterium RIFCSPLOWO2_12_FULL_38_8]HBQ21395.1 ATP-dependent DNA helicase [Deltaproteobacteria bacterium]